MAELHQIGTTATPYERAVARLLELGHELQRTPSHKFDLANMRVLLGAMGHPERRFASILIAGTNGKGSTAATLAAILQAAGHRTGLYTSPHLIRINERIRVDGEDISDAEFAEMYDRVEPIVAELVSAGTIPWHPSFFEMLTAIAFEHFASSGMEIAVLEVGMGGRLDATNVVDPCISVITDIALDHQEFLGNTLTEIAREKVGIIRENGIVVTLPQHPEANDVIGNTCLERRAQAISAVKHMPPVSPGAEISDHYELEVMGERIQVSSPLTGRHQLRNVALAITAAEELNRFGFRVRPQEVERGIRETRWPGRFQVLPASSARPEIVLDVAHNPAGAWALRSALSQSFEGRSLIVVFGAMRDKAIAEISEILFPVAEGVIATQAHTPRAASVQEITQAAARSGATVLCAADVPTALRRAFAMAKKDSVVVITGSIYVVGEALAFLEGGKSAASH